jgi:poly(hydroxyalkanoate) depolymerase family esterase
MKIVKTITSIIFLIFLTINGMAQGSLTPVSSFGSNPGSLNMYYYAPSGLGQSASLVIALHGCTQTASMYASQTGWNKLANRHKFIVVYPEQVSANNSSLCFNWFDATDQSRDQGETLSIKQMVDYMKSHYAIDTTKIFVTGLSAGAGMTSVMLADYPEIFNKGAIMAGLPYKASSSSSTASLAMGGYVTKTPAQWSALVKNENPNYLGPFPHVAIFHGTLDLVVNINNATELIKQWTDLNNADQTADATNNAFQGNSVIQQTVYNDNNNNPVVYYYKITGMGHGIALDTGACPRQGGATGTYAIEENFHSTYWAAYFFGILINPYSITGAIQVTENATNITYSVPNTGGSTYTWSVPPGATIVTGQGNHSIVVNFGTASGYVTVQETTNSNCINDIASLYVKVLYTVTVSQTASIACHGSATASLLATVTGGATPYTYSWSPSGGTSAVANGLVAGVYTVTVTDNASVVVASSSFTVNQPAVISKSQTITLCAGHAITIGSHTYHTTNTYVDTLTAHNSCDSVLTTHLTVHSLIASNQTISLCAGHTITVGSHTYHTTNTYVDTLTASNSCDSVVTTHLTVHSLISASQTISLCAGQSITVGSHTYHTTNTYTDTLTASTSCDSIVTTHLTVNSVSPLPVSLNIVGSDSLCSSANVFALSGGSPSGGTYSGNGISSGNFNPAAANPGWDIITYTITDINNCTNSAKDSLLINSCTTTGISNVEVLKNSTVYPNPATDIITISTNGVGPFEAKLYNSIGTLILVKEFNNDITKLDIHTLPSGLYLLNLKTKQGITAHRIMKL